MNLLVSYQFNNNEIIGILAGVLVLVSFFFKKERVIRMVNMVGCLLFIIYGALNDPILPPVIGFNSVLLLVHIVYLTLGFIKKEKPNNTNNIQENYFNRFNELLEKLNDKNISELERQNIKEEIKSLNYKINEEIQKVTK